MLEFKNFKKKYNGELILATDHFFIDRGTYWVKGDNGSGKSTLLKCIAGLIDFDGDINFDGESNRKHISAFRKAINYMEAEPLYPKFLKGSDLVSVYKNAKSATEAQVGYLLSKLGVNSFLPKEMEKLSSGMTKKLSLALAFLGSPKLIILDEPFITLDALTIKNVTELISEFASAGVSIIFTSHQESEDKIEMPLKLIQLKDHSLHYQS